MHIGFQWILVVSWVGSLEIGTSGAFGGPGRCPRGGPGGPPRGPFGGGPEGGGERYQHFEEIVGALRTQIFRSEFMHIGFQLILVVSWVGSLEIGVGARVRGGGG